VITDPVDLGRWEPLSVGEVAALFAPLPAPWWIAGGWAIDLFVGSPTRPHDDIDVQILRRDQLIIQETLRDWELWAVGPPGTLRPWRSGEVVDPVINHVWCRRSSSAPWALQLMLAEADEGRWIFRRDRRISMPLAQITHRTADGTPYIAPEAQLLFKSGALRREKEEAEFEVVLPKLDEESRGWLEEAIAMSDKGHPWLMPLDSLRQLGL
jgi:hypothetical protein